ncbi:MAG TPA: hypothetical protein VM901_08840 [Bdellovibrionota bacterium]|jgi:hypothetical protein|nr:hypothetical protein [Bdellovibrionota bacterium]
MIGTLMPGPLKKFMAMSGLQGMAGSVLGEFAVTFFKSLSQELKDEHHAMKQAWLQKAEATNKIASA